MLDVTQHDLGRAPMAPEPPFGNHDVVGALERVMGSDALQELWQLYKRSESDENPAQQYAQALKDDSETALRDPALLSFAIVLSGALADAFPTKKKGLDPDVTALRNGLRGLKAQLWDLSNAFDLDVLPLKDLPKKDQQLINIVQRQTGQIRHLLAKDMGKAFVESWRHILKDIRTSPIPAAMLSTVTIGLLLFMNRNLGGTTSYIDPGRATITPDNIPAEGEDIIYDPNARGNDADLAVTCHDHLEQATGIPASFSQTYLNGIVPQHCAQYMTLAVDIQDGLNWAYEGYNLRLALVTEKPVSSAGEQILVDSPFMQGFEDGTHAMANFVYAFNTVENIAIHSILFGGVFAASIRAGHMDKEEFNEAKNAVGDFVHRTLKTRPLAYAGSVGGVSADAILTGGVDPTTVWAFVGGGLAGYSVHKIARQFNRKAKAVDLAKPAKAQLLEFQSSAPTEIKEPKKKWGPIKKTFAAVSGLTTAGYVTLVSMNMNGEIYNIQDDSLRMLAESASYGSGFLTGGALVLGAYIVANLPEDTALHGIFSAAALTLAAPIVATSRTFKHLRNKMRNRADEPFEQPEESGLIRNFS